MTKNANLHEDTAYRLLKVPSDNPTLSRTKEWSVKPSMLEFADELIGLSWELVT